MFYLTKNVDRRKEIYCYVKRTKKKNKWKSEKAKITFSTPAEGQIRSWQVKGWEFNYIVNSARAQQDTTKVEEKTFSATIILTSPKT